MKVSRLLLLVLGGCLFLWGCPDSNESEIPDGKDFKSELVKINGSSIVTDINFYSNFALDEFFYYFDHDNSEGADYLVKCSAGEFKVLKENPEQPGFYDILKYTGTPSLTGNHYRIQFPMSALDLSSREEWTTYYWFFAMDGRDRMPDSGKRTLEHKL